MQKLIEIKIKMGTPKILAKTVGSRICHARDSASKNELSKVEDETATMNRLLEMLEMGGKRGREFGANLEGFLKYAKRYGAEKSVNNIAECCYVGLLCFARTYPNNELVEATMNYLNARYPELTES